VTTRPAIEDLLRPLAPRVLAALVRHYGDFEAAEDAVQEALLAAATQWPTEGVPDRPQGWLIRVASRRLTDRLRSDQARRRREATAAALSPPGELVEPAADAEDLQGRDDTLTLLLLCCHPALTAASQIALTLRAVGGLTTAQIARAFLVPETTMAQRVSRAKQRVRAAGAEFRTPPEPERAERVRAVLHVLYLIFNEGYTTTSGPDLRRGELTGEAIRLTRAVHALLPADGEAAGLLALMLLTDARSPARTRPDGTLVPLAEQDRTRWDRASLDEGLTLITATLSRQVAAEPGGVARADGGGTPERPSLGAYQVQACVAAVHAKAARAEDTDWPRILALYGLLERIAPGPVVTLNHAVAVAMVRGPRAGLEMLAPLDADERLAGHHRLHAVRAHLLEMAGYRTAARLTTSLPEQHYLQTRAARLEPPATP